MGQADEIRALAQAAEDAGVGGARSLAAFFPAQEGSFVVGPTFELAWIKVEGADLFAVDAGLVIELPGPRRIVVVGSARSQLGPPAAPLLYLRIDVLGVLDF